MIAPIMIPVVCKVESLVAVLESGLANGGINYWGRVDHCSQRALAPVLGREPSHVEAVCCQPFVGGYIAVREYADNAVHHITRVKLINAIQFMVEHCPSQLGPLLSGKNFDRVTGDCWIQCALFQELRYA